MTTYLVIGLITIIVAFFLYRSSKQETSPHVIPTLMGLIAVAVGVYFIIGSPDYQDQPYEEVIIRQKQLEQASDEELVKLYEQSLEKNDNAQGRFALGGLLARNGHIKKAHYHLSKAYEQDKNQTPEITIAYIQIMLAASKEKKITDTMYGLIQSVLKKDASQPQALFYQGLYEAQKGRKEKAISVWEKLVKLSDNQPWQEMALNNLMIVIKDFDIKPSMIGIKNTPPQDNQKITKENIDMIRSMVKSLHDKTKENPNDKALKERYDYVKSQLEKIEKTLQE